MRVRAKGSPCPTCAARESARAKFRCAAGRRQDPTNRWLDVHLEALEFLETWLEMALSGQTNWSMRRVHQELMDEYGLPYRDPTAFGRRLRARYGKRYDQAIEPRKSGGGW